MAPGRESQLRNCRRFWRGTQFCLAAAAGAAFVLAAPAGPKAQQSQNPVIALGNAAVTGFSGASPPIQIPPGVDPALTTFIDRGGPSLRVVDLQHMGGPPAAQLVGVLKPFTFSAATIGQVFGLALDNSSPPNIYAAATSAYGLPIIAPGPDGEPQHIKFGAPNAAFMPGLWGPRGGPGTIWKIDGVTGAVGVFANVILGGRANSGAALGGLAFDPDSQSLFVADRETGFIHRFGMDGRELGRYDHGDTGRDAQGMPPVPWTSQVPIDITSAQFDSTDPATWNYAAPERRVFGLAVHQHRLYYAVADGLQVWSVGLNADGSFGGDAVIELAAPPAFGPTEISKIAFDEQGRMFLAERPAATGAFDFEALAVSAIGRVLRYAIAATMPDGRRIWREPPDEYAIGFPRDLRNGNGGVAIGYRYDANGNLMPGACGGFMWSTGEDLRDAPNAALTAKLTQSGPLNVDGLQGNETWRVRRDAEPPLMAYFIDYDDRFDEDGARGHLGDIAIAHDCAPLLPPRIEIFPTTPGGPPERHAGPPGKPRTPPGTPPGMPGTPPTPPTNNCPLSQVRNVTTGECGQCVRPNVLINGKCCPVAALTANPACSNSSCPAGQTAIGPSNFCCNNTQVYTGSGGAQACCSGQVVNGKCQPPNKPPITCQPGSPCCGKGYVPAGNSCCLATKMTSTGTCCPSGQVPSGPNKAQCKPPILIPIGPRCCGAGLIPTTDGKCCASANVTSGGVCCAVAVSATDRSHCPVLTPTTPACAPGYTRMPDGNCCNNRFISDDGMSCISRQPACAKGEFRDSSGACVPVGSPPSPCASGLALDANGNCVGGGGATPPVIVPGAPRRPNVPPPPRTRRPSGPPPRGVLRPSGDRRR
jgi:hypothetical protein